MILGSPHGFLLSPVAPEREMCLGLLKGRGSLLPLYWRCQSKLDTPYQQGTACVGDKQILARQEKGVPLGSLTSPALFPDLSAESHTSDDLALGTPRWLGWASKLRKPFWSKKSTCISLQIISMTLYVKEQRYLYM